MGAVLLENDVLRLSKNGASFWLAGLADQMAIRADAGHWRGLDDLPGTLAKLPTMLRRSCWRMSRSSFRARQSASR